MNTEDIMDAKTDLTKLPDGFNAILPMLDFLPDEQSKMAFLGAFTYVISLIG